MADLFTPETAAWGMPAMPSSRRGMNFTKEDLLSALAQAQNQPKSPYQLQFEAPILPPQQPDREADFQNQWDQAMQQYQQALVKARDFNPDLAKAYPEMVDPNKLFSTIVEPLRWQAAEFSPGGISGAFGQKALTDYRTAELAHQKVLEKNAEARLRASESAAKLAAMREQRLGSRPPGFRFYGQDPAAVDFLKENPASAQDFEQVYGPGSAARVLGATGASTTAKPMPSSKSDLVVGQTYITKRGIATWNGKEFVQ